MNVRACRHVLVSDKFIQGNMMLVMIMEVKLKFAPKEASKNYESSHFCSYVFRNTSFA